MTNGIIYWSICPLPCKWVICLMMNALDDRTNKMEGPVSGFMHRIEKMLSKGDESKYP